ncbi:MAG: site-specific DNA-methyltransferase [Bacteroidales bacterium]|nr:site-specific DNA-methyltransferase [Bacteroidales bacterium]
MREIATEYQSNKVRNEDNAFHCWYRFVLSYPPHLVKYYIDKFNIDNDNLVLDPFSGTGTTLVESKLNGHNSVGIEANPITRFATKTKLDWHINTDELIDCALDISNKVDKKLKKEGIDDYNMEKAGSLNLRTLPDESFKILLKNSISPIPLHKSIILIEEIKKHKNERIKNHLLLASLNTIISDVSNLKFGPEVGLGKIKEDASILKPWLENVHQISEDIKSLTILTNNISSEIHLGDARVINQYLSPNSISAVITSPPYPNEKDYSRTTRLENVLVGMVTNLQELRGVKKTFIRSNTRSVYKDDTDHLFVKDFKSIQSIAQQIEKRRIELNKTSGFERMYSKVTLQYFGGMARHLDNLRNSLEPGAKLAYVVGDQASYLRVMIRTGQLLAEIAEMLGYKVLDLELFRTRFATRSKEELREEVLILEYKGE